MKLSPRQQQVLSLLSTGIRAEDVAAVLKISPKTVSSHISHLYWKLGAHNRMEALTLARREGLLSQARKTA